MTTRQFTTNLNCGSCVATVTPLLDGEPTIARWNVDTNNPQKILTVEGSVSAQRVRELVGKAGFTVLGEVSASPPATSEPPAQSYFPLLLIFAYLVGVVALIEARMGAFDVMRAMSHFMGGFFLVFSFFKLLDLRGFADSYAGYDLIASRWRAYGLLYPFIELGLGVAYLAHAWPMATNLLTLVVMAVSSVGVIQSLLARRKIRCACLGAVFNLPMSSVTLLEDGLMVVMAAVMLVLGAGG